VVYTFFPLHPDTPPGGVLLSEYFRGRRLDIDALHRQMKARMDAEGLPYAPVDRMPNSRLAQELGRWADGQRRPEIHDLLYRAYAAEKVDIADPKELARIAGKAGLDVAEAEAVLSERRVRKAVDADWERARDLGITAVPTFVAGEQGVAGAQPYEVLEELVLAAGAKLR
jgi:predicted DsbA family dithiol-disulfide isomerase